MTGSAAVPAILDRHIEAGGLPVPSRILIDRDPVEVWLGTPDMVERWSDFLGIDTARRLHVAGRGQGERFALAHLSGVAVKFVAYE